MTAKYRLVFFDVDSTLVTIEGIDVLAGENAEVARLTAAAMNGEIPLDQVKRRFAARLARHFLARDEHIVALDDDTDGAAIDARKIDDHFDGVVGFVDVDGRGTFGCQSLGAQRAAEFQKDPMHLVCEISNI